MRLDPKEAAAYIRKHFKRKCSPRHLANLRSSGSGPQFYFCDGGCIYDSVDLDTFYKNPPVFGPFKRSSERALFRPRPSEAHV